MTITVGVVSQKGGTRKSTICRALGVAYTKGKWVTRIADMDTGQATTADWNLRREERGILPALDVKRYTQASFALADRDGLDMMIIDGRPFGSDETAKIALASDLILIPTGNGLDDLKPSVILGMLLADHHGIDRNRIAFPLTNMGNSLAEIEAAQVYIEKAGFSRLDGNLTIKTSYSLAHDMGRAVNEAQSYEPKRQAKKLIQAIIQRIEQLTDQ